MLPLGPCRLLDTVRAIARPAAAALDMLASVTPMQHACPARSVITPDGVIAAYP